MPFTKTLAPLAGFPYLVDTERTRRLLYALNREFLFARHPKFDFAQTVGYPRGPLRRVRRGNSLGIFIFRRNSNA